MITVFPNPCFDNLYYKVKTEEKDIGIQLVNLTGEIVILNVCKDAWEVFQLNPESGDLLFTGHQEQFNTRNSETIDKITRNKKIII